MWQWIIDNVGVTGVVLGVLGLLVSVTGLIWSIWSHFNPKESSQWSIVGAGIAMFGAGGLLGWLVGKNSAIDDTDEHGTTKLPNNNLGDVTDEKEE